MTRNIRGGPSLLIFIALITFLTSFFGQVALRSRRAELSPVISPEELWKTYRWSPDPNQRREAALLLASKSKDSPWRRQRLLLSQGWGKNPLAAVAIKLQAQTETNLGNSYKSEIRWKELLNRFPFEPLAADAYYILGRQDAELRQLLLNLHPAHPASLASALELKKTIENPFQGALHLARWGARWLGAQDVIKAACSSSEFNKAPTDEQREVLAFGMTSFGDGKAALECLNGQSPPSYLALAIGKILLDGDPHEQDLGNRLLKEIINKESDIKDKIEAIKLLTQNMSSNELFLKSLSSELLSLSPDFQIAEARKQFDVNAAALIKRWPNHSESWQLQWDLVRAQLLNGRWDSANRLLEIIPYNALPEPYQARRLFWKGFFMEKQGDIFSAKKIWLDLVSKHPKNYYTWRAQLRLTRTKSSNQLENLFESFDSYQYQWRPLLSNIELVNKLWRLGLEIDAWETWRSIRGRPSVKRDSPQDLIVEGRLRMAVGDDWMGLNKLSKAKLNLVGESCETRQLLHSSLFPLRYLKEIKNASLKTGVPPELLLAVAKQESRMASGVISSKGAVGLMQLMPATAYEVNEAELSKNELIKPEINILLAAKYLAKLMKIWEGNLWLTIASYNAGPSTVSNWFMDEINNDPELWVERIPYPETRFYTKKVLGNIWSYLHINEPFCS